MGTVAIFLLNQDKKMADGNFVYLTRQRIVEIEKVLLEMKTNGRKNLI